ncbi:MAG TPA: hypothetical protein VFX03_07525, partial [Thermomicrobiales bacterium]|nr:hypothetical protein [Thermomicrobiales bacterium]
EYLVWRVRDGAIDWFRLDEGKYAPQPRDPSGIYKSSIFPGLWLDAAALVRGDLAKVLAVLQQGTAAPEHARFIAQLDERRRVAAKPPSME